jgi:hypothetical protein
MRPGNLKTPDTEIKKTILGYIPKGKLVAAIDDRLSVIRMLKSNGVRVIPVRCEDRDFE